MDNILAYRTTKVVKIRDWRLGLVHGVLFLLIQFFIYFYLIYTLNGWQDSQPASGLAHMLVRFVRANVSDASCGCNTYSRLDPACSCVFLDPLDGVYPEVQEYSIFIPTRVSYHTEQRFVGASGAAWTSANVSTYRVVGMEQFLVNVSHSARINTFYQQDLQDGKQLTSEWQRRSTEVFGLLLDQQRGVLWQSKASENDVFPIELVLRAAGTSYAECIDGASLHIVISYTNCADAPSSQRSACEAQSSKTFNYYSYTARRALEAQYSHRIIYSTDGTARSIVNMTGIRMSFFVTGQAGKFSLKLTLLSIVSGYVLLSLANAIADAALLWLLPGRKLYRQAKYTPIDNFNETNVLLASPNVAYDSKYRIVMNLCAYRSGTEVLAGLDQAAHALSGLQMDELCLAALGECLHDAATASAIIERITGTAQRITALRRIGALAQAYHIAVGEHMLREVEAIYRDAVDANDPVADLCAGYIQSRREVLRSLGSLGKLGSKSSFLRPSPDSPGPASLPRELHGDAQ